MNEKLDFYSLLREDKLVQEMKVEEKIKGLTERTLDYVNKVRILDYLSEHKKKYLLIELNEYFSGNKGLEVLVEKLKEKDLTKKTEIDFRDIKEIAYTLGTYKNPVSNVLGFSGLGKALEQIAKRYQNDLKKFKTSNNLNHLNLEEMSGLEMLTEPNNLDGKMSKDILNKARYHAKGYLIRRNAILNILKMQEKLFRSKIKNRFAEEISVLKEESFNEIYKSLKSKAKINLILFYKLYAVETRLLGEENLWLDFKDNEFGIHDFYMDN